MQDRVGQLFGNYRLTRLIGKGGYAEVYLAEHIYLHNLQHAIKVLTGTNLDDEQREEFLQEARTVADLQHLNEHIVQILDFGIRTSKEDAGRGIPYFIMEYAREGTLRSLYPRGTKVPLERIIFYIKQIAAALQCAHNLPSPIVHCDIKPENMLLRNRDFVLLSDFGIAVTGKTGRMVQPGKKHLVGTATYIAPERLSGNTKRAGDQYSLGVVVYEWLAGYPPFEGSSEEICFKHLSAQPPALYPDCPHVTPEIEQVVMRALAKKPEDRYPKVQDFADALETSIQSALRRGQQVGQPGGHAVGGQQNIPVQQPVGNIVGAQQQAQMTQPLGNSIGVQQGRQMPQPVGNRPGAQLKPSPSLPQMLQPNPNFSATTEPATAQRIKPTLPVVKSPPRQTSQPLKKLRDFFELSPQFAQDSRNSFFRNCGIVLNMLSAIIIWLTLHNIYATLAGLVFSWLMFALCIRAVEEVVALFFGALVALYWGAIGWIIGGVIATLLQINTSLLTLSLSFVFFSISLGLHRWYVARKNL